MDTKTREALELALKKEKASYKYYLKLYRAAKHINQQKLFNSLAIQELRHESLLKDYLKTEDFQKAKNNMDSKYEKNPGVADKFHPGEEITNIVHAIRNALKKEQEAEKMYRELYVETQNNDLKALFLLLADEELKHWQQLKQELDKLVI